MKSGVVSLEVKQLNITPGMLKTYAKHVQKEEATIVRAVPPEENIEHRKRWLVVYHTQSAITRKLEVVTEKYIEDYLQRIMRT